MARSSSYVFLIAVFLVFSSLVSSIESRKMLAANLHEETKKIPSMADDRLFKNALPKGTVPASSPSKKGHADTVDEKLVARHLAAVDDHRFLRSVPAPGIGN
nr:precursor of CEP14 [Ipomoea batatas]